MSFSQTENVAINNNTPSATLDSNGLLKIRFASTSSKFASYTVLGLNDPTSEVIQINFSVFSSNAINITISVAKKTLGMSLTNLFIVNPNRFRTGQFNNLFRSTNS